MKKKHHQAPECELCLIAMDPVKEGKSASAKPYTIIRYRCRNCGMTQTVWGGNQKEERFIAQTIAEANQLNLSQTDEI